VDFPGIIVLVSKNSLLSSGQQWEISCAKQENKKILGIWAYSNDRTFLNGINIQDWSDDNISDFINNL
jgi:hypothetical protein